MLTIIYVTTARAAHLSLCASYQKTCRSAGHTYLCLTWQSCATVNIKLPFLSKITRLVNQLLKPAATVVVTSAHKAIPQPHSLLSLPLPYSSSIIFFNPEHPIISSFPTSSLPTNLPTSHLFTSTCHFVTLQLPL
ncbi:uncharacterized protein LOC112572127 [Pomacea canaliculata]|uniref:uncharacterized protein LOC112572127 n=1 Tax=Pomacea canaliculata TaxID=400727 RepID=UPI000D72D859|nr:uncharacterized protein LOC112572127 [Pomacea canaliculata]